MALFHDDVKLPGYLSNKEMIILTKNITAATVKCKCGHSVLIPARNDKKICTWCGEYVYRNKQDEFRYRLGEMRNNE